MKSVQYRPPSGPEDAGALVAVHERCAEADAPDPLSPLTLEFTVDWYRARLAQIDPSDWVIAECRDQIIGYGLTLWDWPERDGTHVYPHMGYVIPAFRGQGIGTELMARVEARCREKAARVGAERFEYCLQAEGRYEDAASPPQRANGYELAYTLWEMVRDLSIPIEEPPLPPGYELRPVLPEHHRAIWQCIGDAHDAAEPEGRYNTIPSEGAFQSCFGGRNADPALWLVAWQGSRVAGQVLCRLHERKGVPVGEFAEVSIGVGHRRRGLARSLMCQGIAALHARQVARICIGTRFENPTAAWRLYEQVGFQKAAAFPRWRKPLVRAVVIR
jgi:mycothiol synthase